jgi:3-oxoacyl-[acyl-carrier-protein] synthase-1
MVYRIADNILSPLGETTAENYQAVKSGCSALRRYEHHWNIPEPFTASLFTDGQNEAMAVAGLTRFESLAYTSAKKAIASSGIDVSAANVVFILSTTKANIELIFDPSATDASIYPGTAAMHIATKLGIKTSPITVCNACISGVSAIVLALRLLEAKCYDYAIVCGADVQNKFTVSGFQSLKAMSENACKPFDIERVGLNLGEAAATLVLTRHPMSNSWAITRGAISNDAFHISSPSKNGEGAWLALSAVTKGTDASRLAFINAHGTATMFNDQMESVAIERAGLNTVPVNAYKGYFGHTLGAAGVIETVLSMAAADDHTILATRGFEEIGVSGKISLSPQHISTDNSSFIKMISGFGGCNGAIYVSKEQTEQTVTATVSGSLTKKHHVCITPTTLLVDGRQLAYEGTGKAQITDIYKRYVDDYPKFYKMDALARLGFVATELLLKAEGNRRNEPTLDRAVILFNRSSSILADRKYLESIANADDYFPSPSVFVYTLPNIVTGEIAMRNLYHGETSFYIVAERNDEQINQTLLASFQDPQTHSIIGGWIDYQDDSHYEADLFITELTNQ